MLSSSKTSPCMMLFVKPGHSHSCHDLPISPFPISSRKAKRGNNLTFPSSMSVAPKVNLLVQLRPSRVSFHPLLRLRPNTLLHILNGDWILIQKRQKRQNRQPWHIMLHPPAGAGACLPLIIPHIHQLCIHPIRPLR